MKALAVLASMALCASATAQQGPPTATNRRSRCAELGEKIMVDNAIGVTLTQSQLSHYDPRTNRCYVELTVQTIDRTGPKAAYYRYLIDGQTKEHLAFASENKGIKSGTVFDKQYNRGKTSVFDVNIGWDYANSYIDQKMAEDRY